MGHGAWTSRIQTGYKGEHIGKTDKKTDKTGREGKKEKKRKRREGRRERRCLLTLPAIVEFSLGRKLYRLSSSII